MRYLIVLMLLVSCGKDGKNGANGLDGVAGGQGAKGEQGNTGDKGDKGDTGAAGQDSDIGAIKFCPNLVDSYGVQYSEFGFCIHNKIYAVYWSGNNSFLTELSNGVYRTTTDFGNCTFRVSNNCQVTLE